MPMPGVAVLLGDHAATSTLLAVTMRDLLDLAEQMSLLLLTGGLATLTMIMGLVGLQGLIPNRDEPTSRRPPRRQSELRPLLGPRLPARRDRASHPLDNAMVRLVREGRGEPRIVRHSRGITQIRFYHCAECSPEVVGDLGPVPSGACPTQRKVLEEALRPMRPPLRRIVEVRCTRRGDPVCEFEVKR